MWFTQHSANNSNPLNEHRLTFLVQENRNHWESGLKFHLLLHKRCLSSCRTHWHKTQMFIHYHKFYMVSELTGNKKKNLTVGLSSSNILHNIDHRTLAKWCDLAWLLSRSDGDISEQISWSHNYVYSRECISIFYHGNTKIQMGCPVCF